MPRTGSTTIRRVLDDLSDIKSVHISEITKEFPFYHHISALELKNIFARKGWKWDEYRRFCVVRNPYDRVVSLFHLHLKLKDNGLERKTRGPIRKLLYEVRSIIRPIRTFKDFVMQINQRARIPTSLKAFIFDNGGNALVEDILMYEKLNEDLRSYLDSLGIKMTSEDMPRLNVSEDRGNYRDYYDHETRKRVEELYAYEIQRFGYHF
jgi:hypothetical protein